MGAVYETIIFDKMEDEHIAKITLNRPARLNAITRQMQEEIVDVLGEVDADDNLRVLVLTGAGRAFCSGADVGGMRDNREPDSEIAEPRSADAGRRGFKGAQNLILGLQRLEMPTIAMLNGLAVGAGFDLASVCDLRVGCPDSRFMVAYVRIGLFPGYGGTWLYPRVLGSMAKAAELLFTGDWLDAEEAYRLGYLNRLVDKDKLEEETMALAARIGAGPPISQRLSKLMLYRGLEMDLETSMLMVAGLETLANTSEDHREGVAAFREKRKAVFKGR